MTMLECPVPLPPPAMAIPALFAIVDGSTMAVTLDQDFDEDGDIRVEQTVCTPDMLTAVMRIPLINRLYKIHFDPFYVGEAYLVRLEDNSILVSTGHSFPAVSTWVTINSENYLSHRPGISIEKGKLIFIHLLELEYTFS